MAGRWEFAEFALDPEDRRLLRGDAPVELNGRYLDALVLLLREAGRLVTKDRFLDEVWRGMAVTDEALTQCIRTLRRQLGDDAARPRFIATVPKHGYRFIAPVDWVDGSAVRPADPAPEADGVRDGVAAADAGATLRAAAMDYAAGPPGSVLLPASASVEDPPADVAPQAPAVAAQPSRLLAPSRHDARLRGALRLGVAGTGGAVAAGVVGGLCYGFAVAASPLPAGTGAVSVLLILVCLTVLAALMGGAGVAFGIAAATLAPGRPGRWAVLGGAGGGLLVGAVAKLLGLDAFSLLLGRSPGDITGAFEGLLLGGAVGAAPWWLGRAAGLPPLRRCLAVAAASGAAAGLAIPLLGGRLMGGSLALLARHLPASRLRLDAIGRVFGEAGLGPVSQAVTGALEGALFAACIVGAMRLAWPAAGDRAGDRARDRRP